MVKELSKMKCEACQVGAPKVTDEEAKEYSKQIPEWIIMKREDLQRLERVYSFKDFVTALDFTNKVGALAEKEGHHPAILTEWGKVGVAWWTHAISGLHRNDFIMAARTEEIYKTFV
ncbi:4a-hydroxytetrahydrobiopterin dehydratase [Tengunoibacter tsumagoiensis]|uniref:Putative pterin-4-alpha-carbinolamine dehydratase n=1 Tax=Tengunoibacter tsumagoiensis TaxID=2014871 RepID=A0A402A348_9CHLR|nr:4a-hydroxytetrahydrobiopterin dehydratase [Tengunoibacter tsumagoiensis]GCE13469.1 putative pterin-4-alpha-carbinolamine dehydratase [Tengunoibacter tsumagoiensis]